MMMTMQRALVQFKKHLQQKSSYSKAELLQLKPHPFICMKNFIDKKLEIKKTMPTFIVSVFKVAY